MKNRSLEVLVWILLYVVEKMCPDMTKDILYIALTRLIIEKPEMKAAKEVIIWESEKNPNKDWIFEEIVRGCLEDNKHL